MATVSVPGKLILMGEHTAVYGRPAVTTAVDLRLTVRVAPAAAGVALELPDLGHAARCGWEEIGRYAEAARRAWTAWTEGGDFSRPGDPAAVVKVALGEVVAALGIVRPPGVEVEVRSRIPVGAGFGSSAAVSVGVVAALLEHLGEPWSPERVAELALEAEKRQHGRPSGVDHGTVLRGGVLWAERGAAGLGLTPIEASPAALSGFRILHTGEPAEPTGVVVAEVGRRRAADPAAFDALLDSMQGATGALRSELAAARPDGERLAAAIRTFQRGLERFGVVPEPVRAAVASVESAGGAAKISGAGAASGAAAGCLLVFWPAGERPVEALAGFRRYDCAMGAEGLRREAA